MGGVLVFAILGAAAGFATWARLFAMKRGWQHPRLAAFGALVGVVTIGLLVMQFGVAPFFR